MRFHDSPRLNPGSWTLEVDSERIAWLVCDTPDTSTNVLSAAVLRELAASLTAVAAMRPAVAGLVLQSGKPNGFIAGADIKEFVQISSPEEGFALIRAGQAVLQQLEDLPVPSVAALHGFVLGGGLELALACTHRIGVDDATLSLGLPEVMLGIHPGFGGTVRSVRLVGARAALDLMLKGRPVKAARAFEMGLIDRLVAPGDLQGEARRLLAHAPARRTSPVVDKILNLMPFRSLFAARIRASLESKVARAHYPAPYAILELWQRYGGAASGAAGYEGEARSISALMCSPTSRNLVRVFLLQDRLKGLGGKSSVRFKHLHVIGAGVMGGDIAALAAQRGMTVTLQDRDADLVQPAVDRARAHFNKRLKAPHEAAAALARLQIDVAGLGVGEADVVLEAIVENVEAKRALLGILQPRMKAGAVLATNTSSIPIETLAEGLPHPARLVGIHFFNPVAQMQLVEIVRGATTDADAEAAAMAFTRQLDKLPLPCHSSPGFVVNRILMPYINEATFALDAGVPAALIDAAGRRFGMPLGPLELADRVGLDVCLNVGRVLAEAFQRPLPQVLTRLVAEKKYGRKNGEGFYIWRDDKPLRHPSPDFGVPDDLEDRLILPMLNEAVAALREGVIADEDLLDAGVIFATGFAPFRGGPLRYARSRGIADVTGRLRELQARYGERFRPDPHWDALM
jgi:3-hydroxyacyl-CoA dehydrogenase / enoyl-CoA hydratase / 3-hydroxybutyryl-CoA epimerase